MARNLRLYADPIKGKCHAQHSIWLCNAASTREPRVYGTLLQDALMFRMNGMPRAQGCAGAAKHIPVALDTRLPASYGPEVRYRTSSALCVKHTAMVSKRTNTLMAEAGAGIVLPGPYEAGRRG